MRIPFVKRFPAAVATVAGGWLMLVGAFLSWFTLAFNPAQQVLARFHSNAAAVSGVSTAAGKVALGAGVVAVVAGLVAWAASGPRLRNASMVVALAAAVAGGAFALSGLSARDTQTALAVRKITGQQTSAVSGNGSRTGTATPGTSGGTGSRTGRSGKNGGKHSAAGGQGSKKGRVKGGFGVTTPTAQLARQGLTVSRRIDPGYLLVLAGSLIGIVAGAAGLLARSAGAGEPAGVPAAPGGPPGPGGPGEETGERDRTAA